MRTLELDAKLRAAASPARPRDAADEGLWSTIKELEDERSLIENELDLCRRDKFKDLKPKMSYKWGKKSIFLLCDAVDIVDVVQKLRQT